MSRVSIKKSIKALIVAFVVLAMLYGYFDIFSNAWSNVFCVIPPVFAITCALLTQRVFPSFIGAIILGAYLKSVLENNGISPVILSLKWVQSVTTDSINIYILLFIVFIMTLISLLVGGGGFHALIEWLKTYSVSRVKTLWMTYIAGLLIFIDDYANTILVGSTMKQLTDKFKISREKLAFLVDATSAPVAGISVISTWVGYEMGLFTATAKNLGIDREGFSLFIDAIFFRYYCVMMIVFIFIYLCTHRDFGPMLTVEKQALQSNAGTLENDSRSFDLMKPAEGIECLKSTLFYPMIFFMATMLIGFWKDGGGFSNEAYHVFRLSDWVTVFSQSENNAMVLAWSSGLTLIVSLLWSVLAVKLDFRYIGVYLLKGLKMSLFPISMLVLAWVLKSVCDDLNVGGYIAQWINGQISKELFPAVVFVVAMITSFATGTSWGTMAILIPIALPIAYSLDGHQYGLCMMISMGAVLDGAIMGDHCSPISDTTLLSSFSSGCLHVSHVKTQAPYAVLVSIAALVFGYIPAGFGYGSFLNVGVAGVFFFVALKFLGKRAQDYDRI